MALRSAVEAASPYPPGVNDEGAAVGAAAPPDAGRDLFLAGIERALQPLDDPAEIMATVARLVGERLACDRCAYAEAEPDENHFTMTGSYARGLPPLTGRMAMSDFSAETLRCMRAGDPYVVADAFTDERVLPEQRDIYRRTGFAAVVCVPLHKGGRFVAAMAVHQARPRVWTDAEIDLLTTVVARCWESLQRVHALNALRENEERYRLLALRTEELLERERAANHRLRLLQDATAALSAAATPEQVGAIMIAQLRQLLDVESVAAWELRDGVLVGLEMHNWQDGAQERWRRMPLDAGNPVTDAVCRGEQVWFADEGDWGERYPAQRASLEQHGYTGLACLPLMVGESCLGVAIATFTASRTPGPAERATATTLAGQCAQAMHRAGLLAAERRARHSAERFAQVVAELSGATRPADVVELILGQARMMGANGCAVVLHRTGRLEVAGRFGACDALPGAATDDHPLARAVHTREPQWTSTPLDTKRRRLTAPDGTVIEEGDVISVDGSPGWSTLGEVPVMAPPVVEYFEGRARTPGADDADELVRSRRPDHDAGRREAPAAGAGERRQGRGRRAGAAVRGAGHRAVPDRAHVPRRAPPARRAADPRGGRRAARRGPRRAAPVAALGLHARSSRRWTVSRPRSGCSTRRCTSSCRTSPSCRCGSRWPSREARPTRTTCGCCRPCTRCTSRTRCWGCAGCGSGLVVPGLFDHAGPGDRRGHRPADQDAAATRSRRS